MPGRRSPHDGDITREQLIDAAEQLFADEGVDAVSVRSINKAASVAPAAVHYHFGSKDALLAAVLARRGNVVMPRIIALAEEALQRRRKPTSHEIVECVAAPYRQLLADDAVGGARWLRVIAQLSLAQDDRLITLSAPATAKLAELAKRGYPQADDVVLATRFSIAINALIQMMGGSHVESDLDADEPFHRALLDFVAGGLDAAMKAATQTRVQAARTA